MTSENTTNATVAPHAANVAPSKPTATRKASRAKTASKTKAAATKAKKTASAPQTDSKKAAILELMRGKYGATLAELMAATGWQKHSVRGFISGTVGKKMGLAVESSRNADGERCYRIVK